MLGSQQPSYHPALLFDMVSDASGVVHTHVALEGWGMAIGAKFA
jgi:hypothetical protein